MMYGHKNDLVVRTFSHQSAAFRNPRASCGQQSRYDVKNNSMSARLIHASWWVDFRFNGIRHRIRSPENTRSGAQAYEAQLRHRAALGLFPVVTKTIPLFADYAKRWFDVWVVTNTRPSTQRAREAYLRIHLIPAFGQKRLDTIASVDLETYKQRKLEAGLAAKTINEHLSALNLILKCAVDEEIIGRTPKIVWLKSPPPEIHYLTREECRALLGVCSDDTCGTMVRLALYTGMRLGELLGLQWDDLDLEKGYLTVRHNMVRGVVGSPKNNRVRHLPLTPELRDQLVQFKSTTKTASPFVFRREDGEDFNYRNMEYRLGRLCAKAGIKPVGWHTLRHTFATLLTESGTPIRAVQTFLGHASISMTEH